MRRHDPSNFAIPDELWTSPEADEVLRSRDAGGLLRLARRYAGASQTGLTMRTGIAKSEISAIMAGHRRVTSLERFESIADGLRMPDDARIKLGLAPRGAGGLAPAHGEPASGGSPGRIESSGDKVWNVLPPVRGFQGRTSEMESVAEQLRLDDGHGEVMAIAIHGIAGVGKSQLARAYADLYREEYRLGWWVSAETRLNAATAIGQLAVRIGASPDWSPPELLNFLFDELRGLESWLLIFDNAIDPADLQSFIPPKGGAHAHVLITSRNPAWEVLATPVPVDVLPVDTASKLLAEWSHDQDHPTARALAQELGQLPLAIEQAAAYAASTAISLRTYRELFDAERSEVLQLSRPVTYPETVAATVSLALDELSRLAPGARRLIEIWSLYSPDGIPVQRLLANPDNPAAEETSALEKLNLLGMLRRSGLVTVDGDETAHLHRLTKMVIEDQMEDRTQRVLDAIELLESAFPRTPSEPSTWPTCAQLAPHASSVIAQTQNHEIVDDLLAALATRLGRYYLCSGLSFATAHDMHEFALALRRQLHEDDHPELARALVHLAVDLNELGDPATARHLHEEALAMRKRLYSDDHQDVAHSLDNLGNVLNILQEHELARQYHQLGLDMRQRLHHGDHPNVAYSLSNLAADLHQMGDLESARSLNEQALAMRQRLDSADHPDIAHSLSSLAADLRALGDYAEAKRLAKSALRMRRRLYVGDHPNTAQSLRDVAASCRGLGQEDEAMELEAEADLIWQRQTVRLNEVKSKVSAIEPAHDHGRTS